MDRDSYNYRRSEFRGAIKFSCLDCPFYVFHQEAAALSHCRRYRHGVVKEGSVPIEQFIQEQPRVEKDVTVTLGYLCWNTRRASVEGSLALMEEADRLRQLGIKANVAIFDNGSQDGTLKGIRDVVGREKHVYLDGASANLGISVGRNAVLDMAVGLDSTFVMFMDGDIEIVPLSAYVMYRYMECHQDLGCIGAYSSSYTRDRKHATQRLYEIPENRVKGNIKIAWTQYGLFRCAMFQQGIRFDEHGPFGLPGWGFEDDDFYYQMVEKGWESKYFGGMCYLHRNIRSSWPNLEAAGVHVPTMFKKRKEYLLRKWQTKALPSGILKAIEAQHCPA